MISDGHWVYRGWTPAGQTGLADLIGFPARVHCPQLGPTGEGYPLIFVDFAGSAGILARTHAARQARRPRSQAPANAQLPRLPRRAKCSSRACPAWWSSSWPGTRQHRMSPRPLDLPRVLRNHGIPAREPETGRSKNRPTVEDRLARPKLGSGMGTRHIYTLRGHKVRFLYPHPDPLLEGVGDVGNRNLWSGAVYFLVHLFVFISTSSQRYLEACPRVAMYPQ